MVDVNAWLRYQYENPKNEQIIILSIAPLTCEPNDVIHARMT